MLIIDAFLLLSSDLLLCPHSYRSLGLNEVAAIGRLSLLSCSDLRLALLQVGELSVEASEWKKVVKYEAPYHEVSLQHVENNFAPVTFNDFHLSHLASDFLFQQGSKIVGFFWRYVEEMNESERLELLRWMTGLFCLPPGGFSSVQGFCIAKDHVSTDRLPSVSTCSFTLTMPDYESFDKLASKLRQVSQEFSFGRA